MLRDTEDRSTIKKTMEECIEFKVLPSSSTMASGKS